MTEIVFRKTEVNEIPPEGQSNMPKDNSSPAERLADELINVQKLERDAPDANARQQVRKATQSAQLEYLRQVSPPAADAWEASRP